ncbi:ABC transporter ATP-binding protein [Sphingorhabdus arenilitoris]|uniref:ABC transporter ATP-binding protein n=1 Tax=Sphingorhabdus arenilitoris TaxID=1490041 RepID=A0ABV8RHI0_9SPHN
MFEASGLTVRAGGAILLNDVSVQLPAGQISVILGPNGAGKSTLFGCLSGLLTPDEGAALWDGQNVAAMDAKSRAQRIGLLPQSAAIYWDINVRELVALGRYPFSGVSSKQEDDACIDAAMAATDCAQFSGRRVRSLSGGERARVLLARVLAGRPQWLLADEPLAGLDPRYQMQILRQIRSLAATGTGVALVLHDLTQAARVADHIVLLHQGRVFANGLARDVLTAANMKAVYDIACAIYDDEAGQIAIIPRG